MLCRHAVFGASVLYRDVGELLIWILPSPHTRPTEPDCARSARPELGTVAEKPPRIGSSCVTVPPSDRTPPCKRTVGRAMAAALTATVIRLLHPLGNFPIRRTRASVGLPGPMPHRPAGPLIEGERVILLVPKVVGQTRTRGLLGEDPL